MAVIFQHSPNRVSETELRAVEEALGVALPADYRAFLLAHNGGEPEPRWFAYPALSQDHERGGFEPVQFFYSVIQPGPSSDIRDLQGMTEHFRSELGLPREYVPVALTQALHDVVVVATAGRDRGKVYYWSAIESGFDTSFFVPLAETFAGFLGSLGYPASAAWMELIDRGDAAGVRRWLEAGGQPKRTNEETGTSAWAYADYACQLEIFELLDNWPVTGLPNANGPNKAE